MPIRKPVVAGRFYPADQNALQKEIKHYLEAGKQLQPENIQGARTGKLWAAMLPHAGYVFCGSVIGAVLSGQKLPENIVILCPNHTGYGTPLSVWPDGEWITPLGDVPINQKMTQEILDTDCGFQADMHAHLREHSIEVLLPFLKTICPDLKIVPICVGTANPHVLQKAATGLADVLSKNSNAGIVVSSDMNHYENERETIDKDEAALRQVISMNPEGLLEVTVRKNISMCGVAPMALALMTARILEGITPQFIGHTTSGQASGDHDHVVGYAGVRFYENA